MASPAATLRAYSPFLIEWTETASVIVSTRPDCSPVIRIRKLPYEPHRCLVRGRHYRVTYNRAQQSDFSSFQIRLKRSMSCVASCS